MARHTGPVAAVLGRRRVLLGMLLATVVLPLITVALSYAREHLTLVDDLLVYLLAVVGVTLVGGFWIAVLAAAAASLLLNWFFTPPLHTWTIASFDNLVAIVLFLTTAVVVSVVVQLAERRRQLAQARTQEADALLELARTVLTGQDTAEDVLNHLRATLHLAGHLDERTTTHWRLVAGPALDEADCLHVPVGASFRLCVAGTATGVSARLLEGFAAQAAAACERQRLRAQAAQTETLTAANRMRIALLNAVSHDLRTPLASVKAAVSSLRQDDVVWSETDSAELLETI